MSARASAVVGMALIGFVALGVLTTTAVRQVEIDKETGRLRHSVSAGGLILSQRIEETPFSALAEKFALPPGRPVWRPVTEQSWLQQNSPNFYYHGVPSDLRAFILAVEGGYFPESELEALVPRLTHHLRSDRPDEVHLFIEQTLDRHVQLVNQRGGKTGR